jgi:ribonuclease D
LAKPGGIETEWGEIATDEAVRHSGKSARTGLVAAFRKAQAKQRDMPPRRVISDLIVRTLKVRRPARRALCKWKAKIWRL